MSYGAYLTTAGGGIFITPESIPLALTDKRTLAPGAREVSVNYDPSRPIIPFVVYNRAPPARNGASAAFVVSQSNGVCRLSTCYMSVEGGTVDVCFFSIKPQVPPAWGMAIWDENGTCILTNETRVLTDVQVLGNPADPNNSGTNFSTTLPGRWGVMPRMTGYMVGMLSQTHIPFQTIITSAAFYTGGATAVKALPGNTPSGPLDNSGFMNYRNRYLAVNLANY